LKQDEDLFPRIAFRAKVCARRELLVKAGPRQLCQTFWRQVREYRSRSERHHLLNGNQSVVSADHGRIAGVLFQMMSGLAHNLIFVFAHCQQDPIAPVPRLTQGKKRDGPHVISRDRAPG
jgi:hypothetical protein